MLDKNILLRPTASKNGSHCQRSKLNSSLIMSPTFKSTTSYYTPKQRGLGRFKSPTFIQNSTEEELQCDVNHYSPSKAWKRTAGVVLGFKKQKPLQKSKDILDGQYLKRKITHNQSVGNINLYNKLKQTASTNPPDQFELRSVPSSPSFFRHKNYSRNNYLTPKNYQTLHIKPWRQIFTKVQLKKEQFRFLKKLGEGKFGKVFLAVDHASGMLVGVKVLQKQKIIEENLMEQLVRELKIQAYLNHPNLIKLYGVCHDQQHIYVIMEFGVDGQLYRLMEKGKLSEEATSFISKSLLQGIDYMHEKLVLHRDIKPQNVVLIHGTVKFCDFGWAVSIKNQLRSTFCGTPLYLSPQILIGNSYDEKVDLWAIGVLAYEMLLGQSPFQITEKQHLQRIITHKVYYPQGIQHNKNVQVSQEFKTFINSILRKNPKERLNSKQLLQLKFICQYSEFETCSELCC